jgi:hypothetical protein
MRAVTLRSFETLVRENHLELPLTAERIVFSRCARGQRWAMLRSQYGKVGNPGILESVTY